MRDDRDRFIFVQAMGKPIVESIFRRENLALSDVSTESLQDGIALWCNFLYDLAGRVGLEDKPTMGQKWMRDTITELREGFYAGDWEAVCKVMESLTQDEHLAVWEFLKNSPWERSGIKEMQKKGREYEQTHENG